MFRRWIYHEANKRYSEIYAKFQKSCFAQRKSFKSIVNRSNFTVLVEEEEDSDSENDVNSIISSTSSDSNNSDDMGSVNHVFAGFTQGFFKWKLNVQWFETIPSYIRMQRLIDRYNMNKKEEYKQQRQQQQQQAPQEQQQQPGEKERPESH